jgi:FecR-like protein
LDKKKLHINEAGSKNYPEPDVPVQDAWNSMKQLLQQSPAAPSSQSVAGKSKLLTKIIAATGSVVIVSTIIYIIATKKEKPETPPVKQATVVTPHRDTLADGSIAYLDNTNKVFEFSNMPFSKVSAYLEKAYGVQFIVKNNKLDDCTITTRFDNKSLEEILDILGYTLTFEYEIDKTKNQVIISGNGCN